MGQQLHGAAGGAGAGRGSLAWDVPVPVEQVQPRGRVSPQGLCVPSHVWSRSVTVGSVSSRPKAQLKAGRETDNSPFTDHQFLLTSLEFICQGFLQLFLNPFFLCVCALIPVLDINENVF